jgi:hypothetical protein
VGDSGVKTYRVPVRVSGHGSGRIRLFTTDTATGKSTSRLVTVRPGSHDVDVPIKVTGNTRYSFGTSYGVSAKAIRGAVVAASTGGLTVHDDDPKPMVSVTPVADHVTEGQTLTWRLPLSAAADTNLYEEQVRLKPDGQDTVFTGTVLDGK